MQLNKILKQGNCIGIICTDCVFFEKLNHMGSLCRLGIFNGDFNEILLKETLNKIRTEKLKRICGSK